MIAPTSYACRLEIRLARTIRAHVFREGIVTREWLPMVDELRRRSFSDEDPQRWRAQILAITENNSNQPSDDLRARLRGSVWELYTCLVSARAERARQDRTTTNAVD